MNAFQLIALGVLALLCTLTVSAGIRGNVRKRIVAFWLLVWSGSAMVLIWPQTTAVVARALGIGRGADLLLYVSVLGMLTAFFYVYTRFRRLDRQITLLVRRLAIENPALPENADSDTAAPARGAPQP